ncbi:MAG: hypothetical protein KBT34_10330 [Prevotella sp.]|nr:hypothetical protein [Candidatus Prevotella equi]
MADTIKERAKDLCSEISNILIHHYKGHGTEFAEAKAVEDAEELINTIKQEIINNACEWFSEHIIDYACYNEMDGWNINHKEMHDDFRKAMEE